MSAVDNGGAAFPDPGRAQALVLNDTGMTLRDYFAAKALGPIVSKWYHDEETTLNEIPMLAKVAYRIADAMLAERAK